jgi:hypothetical protein
MGIICLNASARVPLLLFPPISFFLSALSLGFGFGLDLLVGVAFRASERACYILGSIA